jgi:putative acetyltransferase
MYLVADARSKGVGRQLIQESLTFARQSSYHQVYIESMPELQKAMSVYEKFGFQYLQGPMGNTAHYSCTIWMLKEL